LGQRITGGWQLTGVFVQPDTPMRARGCASGGNNNGSTWEDSAYYGRPWLLTIPASRTNNVGSIVTFATIATGISAPGYQWLKGTAPLADAGTLSGSVSPILTISNLQAADAGQYSVVVTNSFGAVTSAVASLTVFTPSIVSHPASRTNDAGTTAVFSLTPTNICGAFTIAWLKNGQPLSDSGNVFGSSTATLTLSNVALADAGSYSAVVTYDSSSLTSSMASLTVMLMSPQNFAAPGDGSGLTLQFTGTPNYPYVLQSTTSLLLPVVWQSIFTNLSGSDGTWSYTVTNLSALPKCFYRVVAW
jgi:hypothetical protein